MVTTDAELASQLQLVADVLRHAGITRKEIARGTPGSRGDSAHMNEGHLSQVLNGKKGISGTQLRELVRTMGRLLDAATTRLTAEQRDEADRVLAGLEVQCGVRRQNWGTVGQPLPRGAADYVERRLLDQRALAAALRGDDFIVDGSPKIGKSSLLHRLADGFEAVYPGDRVRQIDLESLPIDAFRDEASFHAAFRERLGLAAETVGAGPLLETAGALEDWIGGGTAWALLEIDSLNVAYAYAARQLTKERSVHVLTLVRYLLSEKAAARRGAPLGRLTVVMATGRNAFVVTSPESASEAHLSLFPRYPPQWFSPEEVRDLLEVVLSRFGVLEEVRSRLDAHVDAAVGEYGGQPLLSHDYATRLAESALVRPSDLVAEPSPVGEAHLTELSRMLARLSEGRAHPPFGAWALAWLGLTTSDLGDPSAGDLDWRCQFYRRHADRFLNGGFARVP